MDVTERTQLIMGCATSTVQKYCFTGCAQVACDFTLVIGREDATEMAAQSIRFGPITLVSNECKNNDSAITVCT